MSAKYNKPNNLFKSANNTFKPSTLKSKSPTATTYRGSTSMRGGSTVTGGTRAVSGSNRATGKSSRAKPMRWAVDRNGRVANFNLKVLRDDILMRLQTGQEVYTLEEIRVLVVEMARLSAQWEDTETNQLLYLADLHTKLCGGRQIHFQFPPSSVPDIPFSSGKDLSDNLTFRVQKVLEELNRSMIRMIDEIWDNRRERMLLAARIIRDLEEVVPS